MFITHGKYDRAAVRAAVVSIMNTNAIRPDDSMLAHANLHMIFGNEDQALDGWAEVWSVAIGEEGAAIWEHPETELVVVVFSDAGNESNIEIWAGV